MNPERDNSADDQRKKLYERFKSIAGGDEVIGSDFFDEDDLVEIYDYANDVSDMYVCMEVLFAGARLYPQSDELRIRRDYLYYNLGNAEAVDARLKLHKAPTTLTRLLSLHRKVTQHAQVAEELNEILSSARSLNDEEVIQFLAIASTPENINWLIAHYEAVKDKCEYKPAFCYEMASIADEHSYYDLAQEMIEELTMLEPFNVDYWELLAQFHLGKENYGAAAEAAEYALAIDPAAVKARLISALLMLNDEQRDLEGADVLESMIDNEHFVTSILQALVAVLEFHHLHDRAIAVVKRYRQRVPDDPVALDFLLTLDIAGREENLKLLKEPWLGTYSADVWAGWAQRYAQLEMWDVAIAIVDEADERHLDIEPVVIAEILYRAKRYDRAEMIIANRYATRETPGEAVLLWVLALARLGNRKRALAIINRCLFGDNELDEPRFLEQDGVAHAMVCGSIYEAGVRSMMLNVLHGLSAKDNLPIDDFDPFVAKRD